MSYGQKAGHIAKFIARGLRAEGWFAMEALHYLTNSTASHVLRVEEVRGRSQGEGGFDPDLQVRIGDQSHQLAIKSMPIAGEMDHSHYFAAELPSLFRWMNDLKERAALVTIAYPCSTGDEAWSRAVSGAEGGVRGRAGGPDRLRGAQAAPAHGEGLHRPLAPRVDGRPPRLVVDPPWRHGSVVSRPD